MEETLTKSITEGITEGITEVTARQIVLTSDQTPDHPVKSRKVGLR